MVDEIAAREDADDAMEDGAADEEVTLLLLSLIRMMMWGMLICC